MNSKSGLNRRDLQLLAGIARGPGNYATPSAERVERLIERGVIKKTRRGLALTLDGRIVVWLSRLGLMRRDS
jgi:hypothetical protein